MSTTQLCNSKLSVQLYFNPATVKMLSNLKVCFDFMAFWAFKFHSLLICTDCFGDGFLFILFFFDTLHSQVYQN